MHTITENIPVAEEFKQILDKPAAQQTPNQREIKRNQMFERLSSATSTKSRENKAIVEKKQRIPLALCVRKTVNAREPIKEEIAKVVNRKTLSVVPRVAAIKRQESNVSAKSPTMAKRPTTASKRPTSGALNRPPTASSLGGSMRKVILPPIENYDSKLAQLAAAMTRDQLEEEMAQGLFSLDSSMKNMNETESLRMNPAQITLPKLDTINIQLPGTVQHMSTKARDLTSQASSKASVATKAQQHSCVTKTTATVKKTTVKKLAPIDKTLAEKRTGEDARMIDVQNYKGDKWQFNLTAFGRMYKTPHPIKDPSKIKYNVCKFASIVDFSKWLQTYQAKFEAELTQEEQNTLLKKQMKALSMQTDCKGKVNFQLIDYGQKIHPKVFVRFISDKSLIAEDYNKHTPVHAAVKHALKTGDVSILKHLVDLGANLQIYCKEQECTPFSYMLDTTNSKNKETRDRIIQLFAKANFDLAKDQTTEICLKNLFKVSAEVCSDSMLFPYDHLLTKIELELNDETMIGTAETNHVPYLVNLAQNGLTFNLDKLTELCDSLKKKYAASYKTVNQIKLHTKGECEGEMLGQCYYCWAIQRKINEEQHTLSVFGKMLDLAVLKITAEQRKSTQGAFMEMMTKLPKEAASEYPAQKLSKNVLSAVSKYL